MNIQQLLEISNDKSIETLRDFRELVWQDCSHGHLESWDKHEFDFDTHKWRRELKPIENDRVTVKILIHEQEDTRRYWRISAIWLDQQFVMIAQNAGREGDDVRKKFIVNEQAYRDLCSYVALEIMKQVVDGAGIGCVTVTDTEELSALTSFYGKDFNFELSRRLQALKK